MKDVTGYCFEVPGSLYGPVRFYKDDDRNKYLPLSYITRLVGTDAETLHKVFGQHPYRVNGEHCLKVDAGWRELIQKLSIRYCRVGSTRPLKYLKTALFTDLTMTAKFISSEEFPKVAVSNVGSMKINAMRAKDLYDYLEVPLDYNVWLAGCFQSVGAGQAKIHLDYEEDPATGDYILSLELAKRLAMLSKGDRSEKIRSYFLWMESQANKLIEANKAPNDLQGKSNVGAVLLALKEQAAANSVILATVDNAYKLQLEALSVQKGILEAMTAFGKRLESMEELSNTSTHGASTMATQVARLLKVSRKTLFLRMKALGWCDLIPKKDYSVWRPTEKAQADGLVDTCGNTFFITPAGYKALKEQFST